MADRTRVAIVGYGMGAHHAKIIEQVPELELYGVCDTDESKREKAVAEHPEVRTYESYDAVLADSEVDLIVIVTPHNAHAKMAIAAMDRGKHAITDKPLCLTTDEARAMIAARDRNRVLLSTFHNRRWDRDFLTLRRVLEDQPLGRLYHIQSCVTGFGRPGGWRAVREAMGGWLYDWGAHTLDQILLLTPSRPKHVYAFSHFRFDDPATVEDYVNCTVTFENGQTATTVIGYINKLPMPRWYIIGERGAIRGEGFDTPLQMKTECDGEDVEETIPIVEGNWTDYYRNIADALAGRAELAVVPEQLLPQIAIAQAAYRSIESEQVVPVETE